MASTGAGEVTREAVHSWAASRVEGEEERGFTPLVFGALQYLHGFDLCQDPNRPGVVWHGTSAEGKWIHSLDDIASGLARWQARCELHDADPLAWPQTEDERGNQSAQLHQPLGMGGPRVEDQRRGGPQLDAPEAIARSSGVSSSAKAIRTWSAYAGPMIWTPVGSPSSVAVTGMTKLGRPTWLVRLVHPQGPGECLDGPV